MSEKFMQANLKKLSEKVFNNFTKEHLTNLLDAAKAKYTKSSNKAALAAALADACHTEGERYFISELEDEKDTMKAALSDFGEEPKGADKSKMKSALKKKIDEAGLEKFLGKLKKDTLIAIAKALKFESEDSTKVEEFVEDIMEEILVAGARGVLKHLKTDEIKDICKSMDIKASKLKGKNTNRILAKAFPILEEEEKEEKEGKAGEPSEKLKAERKPIDECESADDMYNWYYPNELKEYCKKNDLPTTGKKMEIIKRIMAFLKNDGKALTITEKKRLRKEKAEERKKRKAEKELKEKENKKKKQEEAQKKKEEKAKEKAQEKESDKTEEKKEETKTSKSKKGSKK